MMDKGGDKMKFRNIVFVLSAILCITSLSVFSTEIPEKIFVKLQINHQKALVNGKEIQLDAPPVIINNRTFVPLRFISEAFGATVDWNSATREIHVSLDNPAYYVQSSLEKEVENARLNEELASKNEAIRNLNALIDKKEAEIQSLKQENEALKKEIGQLKAEIENLKKSAQIDIKYANIQIIVNGKRLVYSLEPFLYQGKVFASLEDICDALGKRGKWDSEKNIFTIDDEPNETPPGGEIEKIGIYTNSFGYYIYVTDPIHHRIIKYTNDGLFLKMIIPTVSTHRNGETWELKKPVDLVTCRLTDIIGVADAQSGQALMYELFGHTHHISGKTGNKPGESQELWSIAMTETDDYKALALLDRKGCKVSLWAPPPGGIKDPSPGTWIQDFGKQGNGEGELFFPEGICYDKNQHLWVADTGNRRVVEFNQEGRFVRYLNGSFIDPCAVGVDFLEEQGNHLYVLDRLAKVVHVFSSDLSLVRQINLESMSNPSSMTIDVDNHLWVTDSKQQKAYKYNQEGKLLLVIQNLLSPKDVTRKIVRVFINKYIMTVDDVVKPLPVRPYLLEEHIMVPVSIISEYLGAEISDAGEGDKVVIDLHSHIVELVPDQSTATVNGEEITLDFPIKMVRGVLFISSGDYAKLFPVKVDTNEDIRYAAMAVSFLYPE